MRLKNERPRLSKTVDDVVATIRMTLRNHANTFDEFWRIWRSIITAIDHGHRSRPSITSIDHVHRSRPSITSLVPRPRFPIAAGWITSPLRGKWVWEIRTTHLFRAYQNIGTDVYIRNDTDVTIITHACC